MNKKSLFLVSSGLIAAGIASFLIVNTGFNILSPRTQLADVSGASSSHNPVITLNGANPLYLTVGQDFNSADPGVTVSDGVYGDYLSGIRRNGGNIDSGWDVDTSQPTTLTITYTLYECTANSCGSDPSTVVGSATASRQVIITAPTPAAPTAPTTPVVPTTPTTPVVNTPVMPVTPVTPPSTPVATAPVVPITATTSAASATVSIQALSCSSTDVQNALNQVVQDGTTVIIPAGTCRWTTTVTYNQNYSTILQGAGAQTPAGGTDKTIIIDDVNHGGSDPATLAINTTAGKAFRMTGIAFYGDAANTTDAYNGMIVFSGDSQSVRIDDNHFKIPALNEGVNLEGWLYGVLDHNLFDDQTGSTNNDIRFAEPTWNNDPMGYGNASWADSSYFGSNKFFFAEDNTFNGGYALDCVNGGRFVFRDNTSNGANMQTHGLSPDVRAGCRAMEVYGNNFTYSNNPISDNFAFTLMLESGTGLFWNNTITGYIQFIHEDVVRSNDDTYAYSGVPNGWGYCGSALGPSPWDGNTNSTGYPCLEQVGRGKGDMITGTNFPNIVDSLTGTESWTHEVSDPAYVWDNLYNPVPQESHDALWANSDAVTVENRDYYLQQPNYEESTTTFNGTAGVGSGLLSSRPAMCMTGVGYWATDTNTLYQCSSKNTWTSYYTPYACPNPLITSGFTASATGTVDTSYCKEN